MKKKKTKKLNAENLVDQYEISVRYSEEDNCFIAFAPSLKGCLSHGDSPEEAIANGRDAVLSWLDMSIKKGLPLPSPDEKKYSGTFNLRLPKSLHQELSENAKREGVSLNQYILHLLSKAA